MSVRFAVDVCLLAERRVAAPREGVSRLENKWKMRWKVVNSNVGIVPDCCGGERAVLLIDES